jgi:outer membrane protein insertion porin family
VTVTVDVVEGRRYAASITGATAFGEDDLHELLTFSRTGFFDEEEVASGRERILAFYQERGYYLAEVTARADYDAGTVVYAVREGRPVRVGSVRLRGFTHFAEPWVLERLETRAASAEEPALLRPGSLETDRRRIESWYRDAGFAQVEVPQAEVWPEAGPGGAEVSFVVREGTRTLVRYLSIAGAAAIAPQKLLAAAKVAEGEPYRAADLQQIADRIRSPYTRAGYPACTVTVRPDFSEDRSRVDLRVTVVEGPLQRLGAVVVTGNGATDRRVILRELPLDPGRPLDPEALARAKLKLYDLGLFREVRYLLPEPVLPGDPQDLVVAVRERPTGFVGFGAGYASDERFRGFVEAGQQNLLGTGRGLRWKTKVSTLGSRHDLFYQEPWLLGANYNGQADLYQERRDEPGYDVLRRGLTLGVNRELAARLVLNLRYRYELVDYSQVVPDLVAELGPLESLNIASLAASVDYDRRDNPILPRRGSFHLASLEVARPAFGGDTSFTKYQLETSVYLPLGRFAEFALGLRGGFTQLLIEGGDLPLSERFFLGGDRTVRGYGYKEIGPKDASGNPLGGNVFALGNAELRFTIRKKLRGVLFLDAGELWTDQPGLPSSGVKAAAGAGLRYETLVGPIRLDWGHKLRREAGESPSRWHLTIGYPF